MLCRNIGVIRPHPTAALAVIGGIALHITRDGKALNVKARQRNLRQTDHLIKRQRSLAKRRKLLNDARVFKLGNRTCLAQERRKYLLLAFHTAVIVVDGTNTPVSHSFVAVQEHALARRKRRVFDWRARQHAILANLF